MYIRTPHPQLPLGEALSKKSPSFRKIKNLHETGICMVLQYIFPLLGQRKVLKRKVISGIDRARRVLLGNLKISVGNLLQANRRRFY